MYISLMANIQNHLVDFIRDWCENVTDQMEVVLVSNNYIYIDIKLYFCFVYRSILKYRVIDVFGERPFKLSRKF